MAINVKDKLVTVESLGIAYSTEQGARQEADQALSTRIDNIVAPEGDPSLTEVSDARVSGQTTYNTLKARLDADKASIGTEMDEIKADLDDMESSTRNLFDYKKMIAAGITLSNGVVSGAASAFVAAFGNNGVPIPLGISFKTNTRYTLSFICRNTGDSTTGNGLMFKIQYTDGTTSNVTMSNTYTDWTEVSAYTDANKTVSGIKMSYANASANTWELKEIQLEEGLVQTEYVPFRSVTDFVSKTKLEDSESMRTIVVKSAAKLASISNGNLIFDKTGFELGNISMSSNGIRYTSSNSRIRTKKSHPLYLPANITISATECEFYVSYESAVGVFTSAGWVTTYTTPIEGYYYVLLKYSTEATIADMEAVVNSIAITPATEASESTLLLASANPLRFKPVYDHLFVNEANEYITIPHESVHHVRLSARMGFNCIEANVAGKTSDGVYIVNHLVSKKFGRYFYSLDNTDLTDVLVSSVTWDYIVQNVRYNSTLPKYRTRPCRLEEFLSECKMHNLIPFVGSDDSDVYTICDKIMGKRNYIAYGATRGQQPDGIIFHWKNLATKADILAYCNSIGKPFVYGVSNVTDFTDEELADIVQTLHANGYWIGTSYADNAWYKYSNMGFDALGALRRINRITNGNVCNIDSTFGFSGFTYTNATETNGVLTFSADGELTPIFTANNLSVGGFDLEMHFDGEIVVPTVGKHLILRYTSDGSYPVFASAPILNGSPAMTIQVKSGTVVYDVSYKVSKF